MVKKQAMLFVLLTPLFILISHYCAVFPHEYAHSIAAWWLGFRDHPFAINYGGTSWANILLLFHIDENVDYEAIYAHGKGAAAAMIAFAGPGIANGVKYLITLFLLNVRRVKQHIYLYYFIFWFNFMNLANFYDYVPMRVFTEKDDMGHISRGLNISPWTIYIILGYIVAFVIWHFYTRTLIQVYYNLKIKSVSGQASLMIVSTAILFGYFGMAGFNGYGEISHFLSATSFIMIPGVIIACWPTREWVKWTLAQEA